MEYDELLKRADDGADWAIAENDHINPELVRELAAAIRSLQAKLDAIQPRPIEEAPQDDTELVVMWDDREQVWDAETEKWVLDPDEKPKWKAAFSQFTDLDHRRGFRHRNGANKATHFIPVSAITALAALEQKP